MFKVSLDFAIYHLNGTTIGHAGEIIGNHLVAGAKGDALKFYDWAVKLYSKQTIIVDKADFKKIRDFVNDSEGLTILAKAPILNYLDSLKESD